MSVVLVGNPGSIHVGGHLLAAARSAGVAVTLCDVHQADRGPRWFRRGYWRLAGKRPTGLGAFSRQVAEACGRFGAECLLAVGIAPLLRRDLELLGRQGVRRLNYLTDDPWNPAHRAGWFMEALKGYDLIFSTRRANLEDLRRASSARVHWLPFAYNPQVHFPEPAPGTQAEPAGCDVLFAGGADPARVRMIEPLIRGGFRVALYGGYWERFALTRSCARGHADLPLLRRAVGRAKIVLGLVRRANRDGHSMRSFEVPAMGGCLLAEETLEHREIFGEEAEAVRYFKTPREMVEKIRWLLGRESERRRLARAARARISEGRHTYRDRLEVMLELAGQRRFGP